MGPTAAPRKAPTGPLPPDADLLHRFEGRSLGSPLRLTVRIPGQPEAGSTIATRAWEAVGREFDAVDLAMSRFRDDSELMAVNRRAGSGEQLVVSRRLRHALAAADRARRVTGGRFDARVLDALERIGERGAGLGRAGDAGHAPGSTGTPRRPTAAPTDRRTGSGLAPGADDLLSATRPARTRGSVMAPDEPIDLGGIGKGLALRWGVAAASSVLPVGAGVLLEAGGDVATAGSSPAGGWLVGIEDPVAEPGGEPLVVVALERGAVATSSVRVRRWTSPDGRVVHHLLDPRTGEPAHPGLIAVTVAGPDAAWAEVWTKALFLSGRRGIADEARARDLAAWWVDDAGRLAMTPAAREMSAWVAESRIG